MKISSPLPGCKLSFLAHGFLLLFLCGLSSVALAAVDVSGYAASASVSVQGCAAGQTLTDFPVLVRLNTAIKNFSYAPFKSADGSDLIFTDSEGNELASDVDTWNTSGESLVWVKIPTLTESGATIKMYFGSTAPVKTLTATNVWSAYTAVWHMNADNKDSTIAQRTITPGAGITATSANLLGACYSQVRTRGQLKTDYNFTNLTASGVFTISGWFKQNFDNKNQRIFSTKAEYAKAGMEFIYVGVNANGDLYLRGNDNNNTVIYSNGKEAFFPTQNTWVHAGCVYNGSTGSIYMNGDFAVSGTITHVTTPVSSNGKFLVIGNAGGDSLNSDSNAYVGLMDEVRVYNGVASTAWIAAEYATVTNATFAAVDNVSFVAFSGAPTITRGGDSEVSVSATLADFSPVANIYAVAIDLESGVAVTNLLEASVAAGGSASGSFDSLTTGRTYSFAVYARSANGGDDYSASPLAFYFGAPGTDRYVATTGSDANDGYSALSPKATLAAALDSLSSAGGTVYLADGTYTVTGESNAITLSTPVALVGMSQNPTNVVITRTDLAGRILKLDHADAKAQWLTLRGGGWTGDNNYPGGTVYSTDNGGEISDCIIEGGTCGTASKRDSHGGCVCLNAGRIVRSIIRNGRLDNSAHRGSGLALLGSSVAEDCLVTGCSGPSGYNATYARGGAVYLSGTAKLINCTIAGNRDSVNAGILFAASSVKVVNCAIFCNKTGPAEKTDLPGGVYSSATYLSCFDHCAAPVELNNSCVVASVPGFTDAANGDYTLDSSSSLVDAGSDSPDGSTSSTDLAGKTRKIGSATDIGCYERERAAFEVGYTASKTVALLPDEGAVTFTACAYPSDGVTYTWNFGDGSDPVETTETTMQHTYSTAGSYAVTLAASRGDVNAQYASSVPVKVLPRHLYARPSNDNAAEPYDSWATAGTKLSTVLAYAEDGCTVHLMAGTYNNDKSADVKVGKAVTVIGEGGSPAAVVIPGYASNRDQRNMTVGHPDAFVCNLTLEGGFADSAPGGGNLYLASGTVSNCVLSSGRTRNNGAESGGAKVTGGLLTHCVITNSYNGNRGAAIALVQTGGRVSNCLITHNKREWDKTRQAISMVSVSGGVIDNCTIVGMTLLKYNSNAPYQMGGSSDTGVSVTGSGKAYNLAMADFSYWIATGDSTQEKYTGDDVPSTWAGTAANFVNCVTDDATAVNATCATSTTNDMFVGYAKGNLLPGAALRNKGAAIDGYAFPSVDLAGNARVCGRAIDVGCYEGAGTALVILVR